MIILQKPVGDLNASSLERFLARAKRATGLRGVVNVLLTNSRELHVLNARFRKKDYPTDVLSFPPMLADAGFAGDVAISTDIARANARHLGHAMADEIRILVLHGVLHLAGYDHESDTGAMAAKERLLRKKLGLPLGLIERTAGSSGDGVASERGAKRKKPGRASASTSVTTKRPGQRAGRKASIESARGRSR